MNLTIFIGGISGGGAERVAVNLANHMANSGHNVTFLTMSETVNAYGVDQKIKLVPLLKQTERTNKIKENLLRFKRLKKYVKEHSDDTYVVMLPITIALLLHFRRLIKGKIIASERNDPESASFLSKRLMKHYSKKADLWVFQTPRAAQWYKGRIKDQVVIPNAINPAFIKEQYQGEREKRIVGAGRLSSQKNFKLLIEAFSKIEKKHADYKLSLYGKGPLEDELKQQVKDLSLQDKVEFMGYVSDMPSAIQNASLFVLSSNYEGMPNALMEAMALGIPSISTDCPCGGPNFLIDDGENGSLVPVGDSDAMASAMDKLLDSSELREKYSNNSRQIVSRLNPQTIYGKWQEVIEKIGKGEA